MQQSDLDAQIFTEQVRLIYRNYPFTLSANFGLSALVTVALWGRLPGSILLAWGAVQAALTARGVFDFLRLRRALFGPAPDGRDRAAARQFAAVTWVTGGCWGAAGLSPVLTESTYVHQIVFQAITGMAFGGAAFLSVDKRLFNGYIGAMLLPTLLALYWVERSYSLALLGFTLALLFATIAFAYNVHAMILRSLVLRFENLELIQALQLQKAEADHANRSKSRFLAAASHDLRQPMHALGLFVGALQPRITDPESRQILDNVTTTVQTLEGMFNALLDISKLDAGVLECAVADCPLDLLLRQIDAEFGPLAEQKGLRWRVASTRLVVRTDPALLGRMLRNLVGNAVRYTTQGGVLVGCRRRDGTVWIEVRDSGIGIPAAQHKEIFQEFFQLANPERDRSKGVGLGLAIVDRLSRLLDHPVALRSAPGRGSTFRVEVPIGRAPGGMVSTPTEAVSRTEVSEGRLIAAIDDDEVVLESMRTLFAHWGMPLLTATGSAGMLAAINKHGRYPDLVISDYRLRDGETGAEAIACIAAAAGRPIPGILVTGDTAPDRLQEAANSGYAVLHKPVRPAKLRALLHHLLDQAEGEVAGD